MAGGHSAQDRELQVIDTHRFTETLLWVRSTLASFLRMSGLEAVLSSSGPGVFVILDEKRHSPHLRRK